jgi:hypothetical protein
VNRTAGVGQPQPCRAARDRQLRWDAPVIELDDIAQHVPTITDWLHVVLEPNWCLSFER